MKNEIKLNQGPIPEHALNDPDAVEIMTAAWKRMYTAGYLISRFVPGTTEAVAPTTALTSTRRTSGSNVFYDNSFAVNETAVTYFRVTGAGTITAGGTAGTNWQAFRGTSDLTVQLTGTATLEYYSVDRFGNTEATQSVALRKDLTPPVSTLTATRRTSGTNVFCDFTMTANETGTRYYRVTGAGTVTAGGTNTTNWQTYSAQVTVQLTGNATIEYYSVDAAGNVEATRSLVVKKDITAPTTTLSKTRRTVSSVVYNDVTLSVNETSTTYFKVTGSGEVTAGGANNTNWQTYTGMVTVKKTGTSATFQYYSVDAAGNTETTKSATLN